MDRELLRNGSGYVDPTAYNALNNVQKGINKMENMKANRFEPKQGDVYLVQKKDNKTGEFKKSPAVVVSADAYNETAEFILMADITTGADPELPQNAPIMCRVPSVAVCDRLRNVKREWIGDYIRTATDEEMQGIKDAMASLFFIEKDINLFECDQEKECEAIQASYENQEQIIAEQKKQIEELLALIEKQERQISEEVLYSDFYRKFYEDLFHSDKKIEIKVG